MIRVFCALPSRAMTRVRRAAMALSVAAPLAATCALAADATANLAALADPAAQRIATETEAQFGGGEGTVARRQVIATDAVLASRDGVLTVSLQKSGATVEATPAILGLPPEWRAFGTLEAVVSADAPAVIDTTVVLPRGRLSVRHTLTARQPTTVALPLADAALAAGTSPLYAPSGVRFTVTWSDGSARTLTLSRLALIPRTGPLAPVVDAFGQRRNTDWPEKVRSIDDLRQRAEAEAAQLRSIHPVAALDEFGGWTAGPKFPATGFFRVAQDSTGRWWFVTPTGHPFWSLGTTGVRVASVTDTARALGREDLYETLPPRDNPAWFTGRHWTAMGDVEVAGNVHFYRWNVLRKYGSEERWSERVVARWHAWGLNSVGAWSDERILEQHVPHTRFLRARAAIPGVEAVNGFPDLWDERWEAALNDEFARGTAAERNSPWLLGYFVDNEARWQSMKLLDIAPAAKLREAWVAHVRQHYGSLERFNAEWHQQCVDWSEVRNLRTDAVPAAGPARDVLAGFEAIYADKYFSTVARLLKQHDPNHLYLGSRFVRVPPAPAIVAAAGRHVDVLSVNCYAAVPSPAAFAEWHRMAGGRPILIGEFDFPLESPRQLPPPWQAFPAEQREQMFVTFVQTWADQPWSLGCHWYQHADQPVLGRYSDGENQTVGFVDVTDTPYEHLVRAARAAAESMYARHAAASVQR